MTNGQIADSLDLVADLLEFTGANMFRVRAYRNGARAIRDLPESVTSIVADDPQRLLDIDGVGKSVCEKCVVLVETGELPQLNDLLQQVPRTVLEMLRIPNLGPRKAAALYNELGIQTLEQLQAACEEGRVRQLKGFGEKTEAVILKGIAIAESASRRIYWSTANDYAQAMKQHLEACVAVRKIELAGSYRRGRETIGALDVLVVADEVNEVMDRFADFAGVADIIVRGETKMSVRLESGLQIDLRVVADESFGAALQYFTGSKDHNVILRGMAKQQGLKINEYGVYRVHDDGAEEYIAGACEKDVYATLQLPVFPPELREARREFEWADDLPDLLTLADVRGDLHMHTTASDGKAALEEMVAAARQRGLRYIAITDHSQRVSMANGLDPPRLLAQWEQIDELNARLGDDFRVLKGIECDILEAGGMDLPDDVLSQADWVLASVHYGQSQSREQITERILGAIENPHVSCIAHPTGRLINRRDAYEVNMEAVLQAARDRGKFLELNASPARLDLHDGHCAAAKELGIPIVVSTDAHSIKRLDDMQYGVLQARRGGLTPADVANTWPLDRLLEQLPNR